MLLRGLLLLLVVSLAIGSGTEQDAVCQHWTERAREMTGNGKAQICAANKGECEGMDCKGTVRFLHSRYLPNLQFAYCYGCQLNSCSKPISANFYLTLPTRNLTYVHTVRQNNMFRVPGLSIKTPLGTAGLILEFEFEETSHQTVKFMVKSKVGIIPKFGIGEFYPKSFMRILFNDTFKFGSCPDGETTDHKSFFKRTTITACNGEQQYTTPKPNPHQDVFPPSKPPSASLRKSCKNVFSCAQHETCDTKDYTCKCMDGYKINDKKDACVSLSRLGKDCVEESDCGYGEECKPKSTSKSLQCKCKTGYRYIWEREMCLVSSSRGDAQMAPKLKPSSGTALTTSSTAMPPKATGHKGKKTDQKVAIIVGATAGGFAVIVAVVVSAFAIKRRSSRGMSVSADFDGASDPLLSADYDDSADLVM